MLNWDNIVIELDLLGTQVGTHFTTARSDGKVNAGGVWSNINESKQEIDEILESNFSGNYRLSSQLYENTLKFTIDEY